MNFLLFDEVFPKCIFLIIHLHDSSWIANILEQMNNLERLILDSKGKSELTEVLIDKKGILTKPRRSVTFSEETQIEDEADQKRTEEDATVPGWNSSISSHLGLTRSFRFFIFF
jgi:hypothetical protein